MLKILLILLISELSLTIPYTKYLHSIETGARCLDGSQAAIYVSENDNSNILIFFNSGGFCEGETLSSTIQSCYKRSSGTLGTSKNYPDTYDYDNKGILSTNPEINPNFWNWTKVYVPYCDGSLHQGSRKQPISYKDKDLYFRGMNNTLQHFKYLDSKYGLFNAEKIVITGISAGAVATFLWSNYVYDNSKSKKVYAIPDSGIFISSFVNPYTGKNTLLDNAQPLVSLVNNEVEMPLNSCMEALQNDTLCFDFSGHPEFQKVPMFIVQSEYDEFSLSHILTLQCQTKGSYGAFSLQQCNDVEKGYVDAYRNTTLAAFNNFTTKLTNVGIWGPACVQHGFSETTQSFMGRGYRIPSSSGVSLSEAIGRFMKDPSNKNGNYHVDSVSWPNNEGCSELRNNLKYEDVGETFELQY